jgi:hypothetical protein
MDLDKVCECGEADELMMCDTCLGAYCCKCASHSDGANHWICTKCIDFDNMEFSE